MNFRLFCRTRGLAWPSLRMCRTRKRWKLCAMAWRTTWSALRPRRTGTEPAPLNHQACPEMMSSRPHMLIVFFLLENLMPSGKTHHCRPRHTVPTRLPRSCGVGRSSSMLARRRSTAPRRSHSGLASAASVEAFLSLMARLARKRGAPKSGPQARLRRSGVADT